VSAITTVECPSEKKESDSYRPLAILHEPSRDVVDRGDVIGVDGMAQPERIGEQRRSQQQRMRCKEPERQAPRGGVEAD